jgi:hypothetical protein
MEFFWKVLQAVERYSKYATMFGLELFLLDNNFKTPVCTI